MAGGGRDERISREVSGDNEAEPNNSHDNGDETNAKHEDNLDSLGAECHLAVDDPDGKTEESNIRNDADDGVRPHHVSFGVLADALTVWLARVKEIAVLMLE